MHESIILVLSLPPASPTRSQYYCNTIAQNSTPFRPPIFTPYTMKYCALQYRVKAKPLRGRWRSILVPAGGRPSIWGRSIWERPVWGRSRSIWGRSIWGRARFCGTVVCGLTLTPQAAVLSCGVGGRRLSGGGGDRSLGARACSLAPFLVPPFSFLLITT